MARQKGSLFAPVRFIRLGTTLSRRELESLLAGLRSPGLLDAVPAVMAAFRGVAPPPGATEQQEEEPPDARTLGSGASAPAKERGL